MRQRIQLTRTNRSEAYPYVLGRRESVSVFSFEGTGNKCLDSSMVEHAAVNRGVAGSSPARGAQRQQFICCLFFVRSAGKCSSRLHDPIKNALRSIRKGCLALNGMVRTNQNLFDSLGIFSVAKVCKFCYTV